MLAGLIGLLCSTAPAQEPSVNEPSGEVAVQRGWFGVGNFARPGEYTGIQLRVNDSNDKPREILIRIPFTDADGDKALWKARSPPTPA